MPLFDNTLNKYITDKYLFQRFKYYFRLYRFPPVNLDLFYSFRITY